MPEDLSRIRKLKSMSVGQLASRAGISSEIIRAYEAGEKRISASDRKRLARALYVEQWDINPQSTPAAPKKPPTTEEKPHKRPTPPAKQKEKPPSSLPARETQLTHLLQLASHFDVDREALETQIGKPLDALTRKEARHWNAHFQQRVVEEKPSKSKIDRRRAYLPEGVDGFEMEYLDQVQASNDLLHFTMFNGERWEGTLIGYGPYALMIRRSDGSEMTLNKLAIAYYHRVKGDV